jgi:hypothetical protein
MHRNRRSFRRSWRYFAMLLGFNLRRKTHIVPKAGRGSLRVEPVRDENLGSDFRRRLRSVDLMWIFVVIWMMAAGIQCLFDYCKPLELVVQGVNSRRGGQ